MASKEDLAATELVPFKALARDRIATIMTGHMALPVITGDDTPCSLSRTITTDLLREEMHYEGVIVTDCLEMEAVAEKYGSEGGAVLALQAGADVVMICHTISRQIGAIEKTYTAVLDGSLPMSSLRESGKRVENLKAEFAGSWDDVLSSSIDLDKWAALKHTNASLSRTAYEASITILRDNNKILPLSISTGKVTVFTPQMESINLAVDDADGVLRDGEGRLRNTAGPSYNAFANAISQHAAVQHIVYGSGEELSRDLLEHTSAVVFATRNGIVKGSWQVDYLRSLVEKLGGKQLVIVSTCAPYDVVGLEDIPAAVLTTMEFTVPALETAVKVVFGEAQGKGKIPVHFS